MSTGAGAGAEKPDGPAVQTEDRPGPKLINQKDIAAEWGVPTRDILSAVHKGDFPPPVRIIGKKRWFRRSDVVKYFKESRG